MSNIMMNSFCYHISIFLIVLQIGDNNVAIDKCCMSYIEVVQYFFCSVVNELTFQLHQFFSFYIIMLSRCKRIAFFKEKVSKDKLITAFCTIRRHSAATKIQTYLRRHCVFQRGFVIL